MEKEDEIEKGARVGVISHTSSDGDTLYIFGFGTFEGDEVPPDEVRIFGAPAASFGPNAKIKLDDGQIVWGAECHWGREADVKAMIAKYEKVETLNVAKAREEANLFDDSGMTDEDGEEADLI